MNKNHSRKKSTKEEFIEKAVKLHGDEYDYSEVIYENNRTEVKIYCRKHKEYFLQKPTKHLAGQGCKKCGYEKNSKNTAMKLDEFIQRSIEKYGNDKFDFSLVNYKNNSTKVRILCSIHGEFETTPNTFLKKQTKYGCTKCGIDAHQIAKQKVFQYNNDSTPKEEASTIVERFIKEARLKFGDKYDYSKVEYIEKNTPITIICPKHGEFKQTPHNHLKKSGCRKCSYEEDGKNKRVSFDEFLQRAKKTHKIKYDYSKVDYVDYNTLITIICPVHGEFKQTPYNHINSVNGCPKCGILKRANDSRKSTQQFIDEATKVHNSRYDYSKVDYKGNKQLVEIMCPVHGSFLQNPNDHLRGGGCRMCSYAAQDIAYSIRYAGYKTIFYVIKYKGLFKIGITTKSVTERYKYEVESLDEVETLHIKEFDTPEPALELEAFLLSKYQIYKYKGANIFRRTNNTEVFEIDIYAKYLEELNNA